MLKEDLQKRIGRALKETEEAAHAELVERRDRYARADAKLKRVESHLADLSTKLPTAARVPAADPPPRAAPPPAAPAAAARGSARGSAPPERPWREQWKDDGAAAERWE